MNPTVVVLNDLNRAAPVLEMMMHKHPPDTPEWDALFYGWQSVRDKAVGLRRDIGERCIPWFDDTAFKTSILLDEWARQHSRHGDVQQDG